MVSEREFEQFLKRMESFEAAVMRRLDGLEDAQRATEITLAKQTGFNSMLPWVGTIVVGLAALGAYLLK